MNNFDQYNSEQGNFETEHLESEKKEPVNVFAMFAKSLGVFSIFCAFFSIFFGAFICGGMAIILAILSKGYNTSKRGDLTKFKDQDKVSKYAAEALSWAMGVGIINGKGKGILDPQGKATRAELAKMLTVFDKKY